MINPGNTPCTRCGQPVTPGTTPDGICVDCTGPVSTRIVNGARVTSVRLTGAKAIADNTTLERAAARGANPCMCCGRSLRNPAHSVCAACAEDMGYARRAR